MLKNKKINLNLTLLAFLLLSLLLLACTAATSEPTPPTPTTTPPTTTPEAPKYTVTFDSLGGSSIPQQTITQGTTATEPITLPTKAPYGFAGWFTNSTTSTPFYFTNPITSNITIYVKWGDNPFTVTFDSRGGSPIPQQVIAQGSTARKHLPTKTNLIFAGWFADTNVAPFDFTSAIASNTTLYAKWRIRPADKQALIDIINPAIAANSTTNLNHIDTSLITDMIQVFRDKTAFNGDISQWNTAKVTNMKGMFSNATSFNQPISKWNTSQVKNMSSMFDGADAFNQPIGNWNTSQVTDMNYMFASADVFNQPIGNWSTSNVTDMSGMFSQADAFNQPIGNWNTSKVTNMNQMFHNATSFNQNLQKWEVAASVAKGEMFKSSGLQQTNYPSWCPADICY